MSYLTEQQRAELQDQNLQDLEVVLLEVKLQNTQAELQIVKEQLRIAIGTMLFILTTALSSFIYVLLN